MVDTNNYTNTLANYFVSGYFNITEEVLAAKQAVLVRVRVRVLHLPPS